MKRCPECGFRAKEQTCPLCGVRMQTDGAPVQTHAHQQKGEKCVLPNREVTESTEQYRPQNSRRSRGGTSAPAIVVVIILFLLLRSCAGIG